MKCWWLSPILCIMQYLCFNLQMEWKLHSFTIFCVTDDDFLHFCHFPCYSCYEVGKNYLYCDMWHGSSVWRLSVTCHKCEHSCHPNIRCEMSHWGPAPISLQGETHEPQFCLENIFMSSPKVIVLLHQADIAGVGSTYSHLILFWRTL